MSARRIVKNGEKFGLWVILKEVFKSKDKRMFKCKCVCNKVKNVQLSNLASGHSTSCGCVGDIGNAIRSKTHGKTETSEYKSWQHIKYRCLNKRCQNYRNYGGRGIRVCNRWRHSFKNFYSDMGQKPSPKHSIDRIENNGHYSCGRCKECKANKWPTNCRWAIKKLQVNNTRRNKLISYNGLTLTIRQWSDKSGLSYDAIKYRLKRKWSTDRMFSTPRRENRFIAYNGVAFTVTQWSKLLNIHRNTLDKRLTIWSIERALTEPIRDCGIKKTFRNCAASAIGNGISNSQNK